MKTPSARTASRRRTFILWLPAAVAGMFVSLAGGPLLTGVNSLDLTGLALMGAGVIGAAREVAQHE